MKTLRTKPLSILLSAIALLMVFLLSACGALTFSPEQAAINSVISSRDPNVSIIEDSVVVHQSVKARDDLSVIIMTYQQLRNNTGNETCLYTYEVAKRAFGWGMKSGGGSCWTSDQVAGQPEDIQIGMSQSSSDQPGDNGFSQAYGLVTNPEIVKVKVSWDDGVQEELPVSGSTFVAFRFGLFNMTALEGMNEKGDVLYTFGQAQAAPGKIP